MVKPSRLSLKNYCLNFLNRKSTRGEAERSEANIINRSSYIVNKFDCVVQLDRISDFGSEGWGFESLRGHLNQKPLEKSRGFFYLKLIISSCDTVKYSSNIKSCPRSFKSKGCSIALT